MTLSKQVTPKDGRCGRTPYSRNLLLATYYCTTSLKFLVVLLLSRPTGTGTYCTGLVPVGTGSLDPELQERERRRGSFVPQVPVNEHLGFQISPKNSPKSSELPG
jgi:hypothetical protein